MLKKPMSIFVIVICILGIILGLYWNSFSKIESTKVVNGKIVETVYGVGILQSHQIYRLKLGIISSIEEFFVKEGTLVQKGQNLLRLADGLLIKAPFKGTVTSLPYKLGETIFPQAEILTLIDLTDLYVRVGIEQEGALKVKPGQKVKFSFSTLPEQVCEGEVASIVPQDVGFIAFINAPKFPTGAIHGMSADVSIELSEPHNATLVPYHAVIGNKLIIKEGIFRRKKVDVVTGITDGKFIEIISPKFSPDTDIIIPK